MYKNIDFIVFREKQSRSRVGEIVGHHPGAAREEGGGGGGVGRLKN